MLWQQGRVLGLALRPGSKATFWDEHHAPAAVSICGTCITLWQQGRVLGLALRPGSKATFWDEHQAAAVGPRSAVGTAPRQERHISE